jgi:type I restriction enzyme S subunit
MKNFTNADQNKITDIPKDWDTAKLGERGIFEVIMGQSPPSSTYNKKNQGLPFLQGKMEFGEIFPSPLLYCSKPIKIAEKNDILISVRAPVGDVNISPLKLCIGRGLASIKCNPQKISYLFLFYFMKYKGKKFENISSGSTFKAIRRNELDNFEILLPSPGEQKKIAEVLSTLDQAIEKIGEAIEKTQRLKKGLMQELLTKGIGHKEFKKTEIGRIPKEWVIKKIKDIGKVFTGKTPPTGRALYWQGRIPFITPADIKEAKYVYETKRNITPEGVRQVGNIIPKDGVLVVCIGSTIGKMGLTYKESVTNQQINAIVCDDKINPHFIYYTLLFENEIFKSFSGVAAVPIIKKSLFQEIKFPVPDSPIEQQKIAEILSSLDKRIESLRNRKEKLEKIKKGVMDDLLTGRKRVNLDS